MSQLVARSPVSSVLSGLYFSSALYMLRVTSSSWFVAAKCGSSVPWFAWKTTVSVSLLEVGALEVVCGAGVALLEGAGGAGVGCGAVVALGAAACVGALAAGTPAPPLPPHAAIRLASSDKLARHADGFGFCLNHPTIETIQIHLITKDLPGSGDGGALDDRHPRNFVRLQSRQDFARKATNLMHEHFVGHGAPIEVDGDLIGTGVNGGADDAFHNLVSRSPGHMLGLLADTLERHPTITFASA